MYKYIILNLFYHQVENFHLNKSSIIIKFSLKIFDFQNEKINKTASNCIFNKNYNYFLI